MSSVDYCLCIEELARVDPGLALSVAAHNGLCTAHLFMFGSESQKTAVRDGAGDRRKIGAWGLTESTSGSDAAAHAHRLPYAIGDEWALNGSKPFTTHGRVGRPIAVIMAVTDRAARVERHLGLRR